VSESGGGEAEPPEQWRDDGPRQDDAEPGWTCQESYAQAVIVKPSRSSVNHVATCLRTLSLEANPESLLGSEEALVASLGAARATVRQAARILEREGLLVVRRGSNGGYFAARPDAETIETAVSAYLDTLDIDVADVSIVAAVLWIEAVRKACALQTEAAADLAHTLRRRVMRVRFTTSFREVIDVEHETRKAIFNLTNARYIELIFQINYVFSRRHFMMEERIGNRPDDENFVRQWRDSKVMELQAIIDGDIEMGVMAAAYGRKLWQDRFEPMPSARIGKTKKS